MKGYELSKREVFLIKLLGFSHFARELCILEVCMHPADLRSIIQIAHEQSLSDFVYVESRSIKFI